MPLEALDENALVRILKEPKNALTKQYAEAVRARGGEASRSRRSRCAPSPQKALKRGTGARGLRAILEEILLDVMFDLPTRDDVVEVKVTEACVMNGIAAAARDRPASGRRKKREARRLT